MEMRDVTSDFPLLTHKDKNHPVAADDPQCVRSSSATRSAFFLLAALVGRSREQAVERTQPVH
jgi:hypothetical protein